MKKMRMVIKERKMIKAQVEESEMMLGILADGVRAMIDEEETAHLGVIEAEVDRSVIVAKVEIEVQIGDDPEVEIIVVEAVRLTDIEAIVAIEVGAVIGKNIVELEKGSVKVIGKEKMKRKRKKHLKLP